MAVIDEVDWQKLNAGLFQAVKKVEEVIKPDGLNIGLNDRAYRWSGHSALALAYYSAL